MTRAHRNRHRGNVALMAILFVAILATLSAGMFALTATTTRTVYNMSDIERARLAADGGMRWFAARLRIMDRPQPLQGCISGSLAWNTLWSDNKLGLATFIAADIKTVAGVNNTLASATIVSSSTDHHLTTSAIPLDFDARGSQFTIDVMQDPADGRVLYVTSHGTYRDARRSLRMTFWMDKKIPFAVIGKVPIQLGKNVLVEGNIAMTQDNYKSQPGILALSDFKYMDSTWFANIQKFQDFLHSNYNGWDNVIDTAARPDLAAKAQQAGYYDLDRDGKISEYDAFLGLLGFKQTLKPNATYPIIGADGKQYAIVGPDGVEANPVLGPQVTAAVRNTLSTDDPSLFAAIDRLHAPLNMVKDPTTGLFVPSSTETPRGGYMDGIIDNRDLYAKIYGQLTVNDLSVGLNRDLLQGPIINPDANQPAVRAATDQDKALYDKITPLAFDACASSLADLAATKDSTGAGHRAAGSIHDVTLKLTDRQYNGDTSVRSLGAFELVQVNNPGTTGYAKGQAVSKANLDAKNATISNTANRATLYPNVISSTNKWDDWAVERNAWGSSGFQATVKRPVFRNITFENVKIPKGMNALFLNCTFKGVTYVESERDIGTTDPNGGMTWSKTRRDGGGAFDANAVVLPSATVAPAIASVNIKTEIRTNGSEYGNNIRFDGSTFNGPVVGNYATAYTHWGNEWQFTGSTVFDNVWKDPNNGGVETATIVSPQVNIETGSFQAGQHCSVNMKGVVVAGNIDIRGEGYIDGSLIVTGDGAGNTTLGYFGANDGDTTMTVADVSKSGYLVFRMNPKRALPDGIQIPVQILPDTSTLVEVKQ